MKVIAAYLLAVLGGNSNPSAADIGSILDSVGAEVDDKRINHFLSEVKGKDITELIAAGREKFASVPSGGAVAAVAVSAGGGGGAAAAPTAEEPKKEESRRKRNPMMIWASAYLIRGGDVTFPSVFSLFKVLLTLMATKLL